MGAQRHLDFHTALCCRDQHPLFSGSVRVAALLSTAPLCMQQVRAGTVEQWRRRGGRLYPIAVQPRTPWRPFTTNNVCTGDFSSVVYWELPCAHIVSKLVSKSVSLLFYFRFREFRIKFPEELLFPLWSTDSCSGSTSSHQPYSSGK